MRGVVDEELAGFVGAVAGLLVLVGCVVADMGAAGTLCAEGIVMHPLMKDSQPFPAPFKDTKARHGSECQK